MSAHTTHTMHDNSLAAFQTLAIDARCQMIIETYMRSSKGLTDREVAGLLGFTELNCVRPRITGLIDRGIVHECGKVRDAITGKSVRICTT